ncbi:MAG: threonine/serine exporter family protein [Eubacteriales bacterium]
MEKITSKFSFDETKAESYADIVLCTALDIGEHLLKNGAEVSRVEDTIERICFAYGAAHVESFSITTLIVASVRMQDGSFSEQMRHVKTSAMNLHRVERLNNISREICRDHITIAQAREKIEKYKRSKPYPETIQIIGQVLVVFGFTLFFGGNWRDGIAASIIALVVALISLIDLPLTKGNLQVIIRSFVAGALSVISVNIGFAQNLDSVIIGTIMMLIPGLAFGTAVYDMFNGNLISGMMKALQCLVLAVFIALGYAAALWIF